MSDFVELRHALARVLAAVPVPVAERLETYYAACLAEGGTAEEIALRGLNAVLARLGRHAPALPDGLPPATERDVSEWINSQSLWHGATRDELTPIVMRALARWGTANSAQVSSC